VRLREWFEAEPWRTALERLQDEEPGIYPVGLLRTLQRRLKIWRRLTQSAYARVRGHASGGRACAGPIA
jgi:hypothetical protein